MEVCAVRQRRAYFMWLITWGRGAQRLSCHSGAPIHVVGSIRWALWQVSSWGSHLNLKVTLNWKNKPEKSFKNLCVCFFSKQMSVAFWSKLDPIRPNKLLVIVISNKLLLITLPITTADGESIRLCPLVFTRCFLSDLVYHPIPFIWRLPSVMDSDSEDWCLEMSRDV